MFFFQCFFHISCQISPWNWSPTIWLPLGAINVRRFRASAPWSASTSPREVWKLMARPKKSWRSSWRNLRTSFGMDGKIIEDLESCGDFPMSSLMTGGLCTHAAAARIFWILVQDRGEPLIRPPGQHGSKAKGAQRGAHQHSCCLQYVFAFSYSIHI